MSGFWGNLGGVGAPGNTGGDGDQPQRGFTLPLPTESNVLRCVSDDPNSDAFQQPAPTETTHGAQPENANETRPTLNTQAADSGTEGTVSPSVIVATSRPTSPEEPPFEGSYDAGNLPLFQQQTPDNAGEMMPLDGGTAVDLLHPMPVEGPNIDLGLGMPIPVGIPEVPAPAPATQDHHQGVQSPQAGHPATMGQMPGYQPDAARDAALDAARDAALDAAPWAHPDPAPGPVHDAARDAAPYAAPGVVPGVVPGAVPGAIPGAAPSVRQEPMTNSRRVEGPPSPSADKLHRFAIADPLAVTHQQNDQGQSAPTMQGLMMAAAMPAQASEDDEIVARNDPMMQAQEPQVPLAPPAPPAPQANNRGRGRAPRAPRCAAAARARPRQNLGRPAPVPVAGPVSEVPLEPWMENNRFLLYMGEPNRGRNSLMRWDRTRLGEPRGLVVGGMNTFKRYETMLQVIHALNDARDAWSTANGEPPTETEFHWPSVSDMKLDNNGVVLVFPETLVNPVPPRTHRFQDLVRELLGAHYEGSRDTLEYLFERAGIAFCGNGEIGAEWGIRLPGVMSASLDMVCGAMARDNREKPHRIPPECTKAVLQLMTKGGNTVTLEAFCKSTQIFGKWWEDDMANSLREVVGEKTHFYIATSQQASEYVMRHGDLGFIIRPRNYYDPRSRGAEWPFALTLLVKGDVEHYVVSFQGGMFRVENMEDPSIVNLAYRFAKSKGIHFIR